MAAISHAARRSRKQRKATFGSSDSVSFKQNLLRVKDIPQEVLEEIATYSEYTLKWLLETYDLRELEKAYFEWRRASSEEYNMTDGPTLDDYLGTIEPAEGENKMHDDCLSSVVLSRSVTIPICRSTVPAAGTMEISVAPSAGGATLILEPSDGDRIMVTDPEFVEGFFAAIDEAREWYNAAKREGS